MPTHLLLLRWAGLALILMVASIVLHGVSPTQHTALGPHTLAPWTALMGLLIVCYWLACDLRLAAPVRARWTVGMVLCTAALMGLLPDTLNQNTLLVLTACVLPSVTRRSVAVAVILGQTAWLIATQLPTFGLTITTETAVLWLMVQVALTFLLHFTTTERTARKQLAETVAELQATRALMEHASREAERMRIAREMHDVMGHHLTVLGLNLELAALNIQDQGAAGPDQDSLQLVLKAQRAQRDLMQEMRAAVQVLRAPQDDLLAFAERLRASVPQLDVQVSVPRQTPCWAAPLAHLVMRFMQETVTNTLRHARARTIWLDVRYDLDGLRVTAVDDGRCDTPPTPGNGLSGLRERFQALGGQLDIRCHRGRLQLSGVVPAGERA